MFKKLVSAILIMTILLVCSLTVFAIPADGEDGTPGANAQDKIAADNAKILADLIKDGKAIDTNQFLIEITKPDASMESTTKKSYVVSGVKVGERTDIRVHLAIFNEETKQYDELKDTEGKSWQDLGNSLGFSNEIMLKKGANKIKIVAYRTSKEGSLKSEDIQVNCFTISRLEESVLDKAINVIIDFKNFIFPQKPDDK